MSEEKKNEVVQAQATGLAKPQDDSTIDGMFRIATGLSQSELVPKHFQKKPQNCFLALQISKRMNIDTFAVLQNLYIVHGTPSFSAKFLIAMANKSGTFKTPIMFRWDGKGAGLEATAFAIHAASDQEVSFSFSMADAEAENYTKNPKYKSMPKLMLAYRAATLFTRLYCPESAMGATTIEEAEDMKYAEATASPAAYAMETPEAILPPDDKPTHEENITFLKAAEKEDKAGFDSSLFELKIQSTEWDKEDSERIEELRAMVEA